MKFFIFILGVIVFAVNAYLHSWTIVLNAMEMGEGIAYGVGILFILIGLMSR